MKVYKFGGASVKDADGVRNVAKVLQSQGVGACILVVSAMGKTTNALEDVVQEFFNKGNYTKALALVEDFHLNIAKHLFDRNHLIFNEIENIFNNAKNFLTENPAEHYNFIYDQIVGCGELVSSKILSEFLNENGFKNTWLDARSIIKTDSNFREGNIDWQATEEAISALGKTKFYVTQGFIGSDAAGNMVTLGREGSDYSAAIFAYATDASEMTIWKDVAGVMTGDPRIFPNAELLHHISYEEAVEMAYYGASVIHPKTLQPLKQKEIPFFVKSFLNPELPGTKIGNSAQNQYLESYILKENQVLLQVSTRDFSFIAEEHLSFIFSNLANLRIKISLMQNTAISLKLCLEDKFNNINTLQEILERNFSLKILGNVTLFTIRNINKDDMAKFFAERNVILEQISGGTLQMVIN